MRLLCGNCKGCQLYFVTVKKNLKNFLFTFRSVSLKFNRSLFFFTFLKLLSIIFDKKVLINVFKVKTNKNIIRVCNKIEENKVKTGKKLNPKVIKIKA